MVASLPPRPGFVIDRRTFLKALALSGAGVLCAHGVLGQASAADDAGPSSADQLEALANSLDFDPERIFRYVADEVRYEPYAGVLRGAHGTLLGRTGNSCDQATLLAALLTKAAVPVRFAWGAVDQPTADAIMASGIVDSGTLEEESLAALAGRDLPASAPLPSPDVETSARIAEAARAAEEVATWADDQLDATVTTIQGSLKQAGIDLPTGYTPMPRLERERHVWVQAAFGAGWRDLDPTIAGDPSGIRPEAAGHAETLPDDLRHRVELSIKVERVEGGALVEDVALTVTEDADVLAGRPITFLNVTPSGLKAIGTDLGAALEGRQTYLPALAVGDETYVGGRPVSFNTGEGVFDVAGDPSVEGETTAEWLELTIDSPDRDRVVVRRDLFDRIGPARRRAGTFDPTSVPPVELVDLDGDTQDVAMATGVVWLTVALSRADVDLIRRQPDAQDVGRLARIVDAYQVVREEAARALAGPRGIETYYDAPNVVAFQAKVTAGPDRQPFAEAFMDIWHRSSGRKPLVGGEAPMEPPAVIAGVVAHLAERILLGDVGAPGTGAPVSVGAITEAARSQGIEFAAIRDASSAAGLPYPPDALARLESSLAEGWIAIAPERPVRFGGEDRVGWWLVDPGTGETADELDDGRGAVAGERVVVMQPVIRAAPALSRLGCFTAGAFAGAGFVFLLAGGAAAGAGFPVLGVALAAGGGTAFGGGLVGGLIGGCL